MNKWWSLTKTLWKTTLGSLQLTISSGKKQTLWGKWGNRILILIVVASLLPTIWLLYEAGYHGHGMFAPMGQEGMIVSFIGTMGSMAVLMFSITLMLSIFYMSRDVETLLALPLRPWQIVGAKLAVSWLCEALIMGFVLLPPLVGYGVAANGDVSYWICTVIGVFLLPIAPMIYAGLALMVLMRCLKGIKNKELLNTISMIFLFVVVIVFSTYLSSMEGMDQAELMALLSAGNNSLLGVVKTLFPHMHLWEMALIHDNLVAFLGFVAAVIVFVVLFLAAANVLYFDGVVGMNEVGAKRKRMDDKDAHSLTRQHRPISSYAKKEDRILLRTPIYFLNCAMLSFIWPLLFLLPVIISLLDRGADINICEMLTQAQMVVASFEGENSVVLLAAGAAIAYAISAVAMCMTTITGTSISREGQGYLFMKYIPMSYRKQIQAKLWSGIRLCGLGTIGYTTIVLVLCVVMLHLPALTILIGVVVSAATNVAMNCLQMFVDLWKPRLYWATETQAVKQNVNVLIETGLMLGVTFGVGFVAWKLFVWLGKTNLWLPFVLVVAIWLLLTAFLYWAVLAYGERQLDALEG